MVCGHGAARGHEAAPGLVTARPLQSGYGAAPDLAAARPLHVSVHFYLLPLDIEASEYHENSVLHRRYKYGRGMRVKVYCLQEIT